MTTEHDSFFINGAWTKPKSDRRIHVVNASTEEPLGTFPEGQEADIDAAVEAARNAFDDPAGWSTWEPAARAEVMDRLATALEARRDDIARAVSAQNGMPLALSQMLEGSLPSMLLRYYADMARQTDVEEVRSGMLGKPVIVRREPIGVVGAIVPWNGPHILGSGKYAPAMAAGATIVMKPSPETVLDTVPFAEALLEAEVPAGVINIVPAGREAGAYLVGHPGIDKVAFTGSSAAGRTVAETCGRLLRPVTLELGGKSAAIILDDAQLDLDVMGEQFFAATLLNNGQTCFLGTRVLAPRSRYQEVVDSVVTLAESLTVGDALDPTTMVGPMVNRRQRDRVEGYIEKGRAEGARVVTGGGRPSSMSRGWFVEPTVFADVDNGHTIAREEIFGPVLSVIPYDDDADAVRIANDSEFGLGGSVWTQDAERGLDIGRRVKTGSFGINGYMTDPVAPYGGVKASGLGKELGPEGLAAYQQIKSIYR